MKPNDNSGDWAGLDSAAQRPRYEAIAALVPPNCSVLDIGCGSAVLKKYLPNRWYIGVESNPDAITAAGTSAVIYRDTAESFIPNIRFDRIILSECCYYMDDPIAVLRKYGARLTGNGRIIITIYQRPTQRPGRAQLWRKLFHWRYPLTNMHCTRMVAKFLRDERWTVHSERVVEGGPWLVIETSPNPPGTSLFDDEGR